MLKYLTVSLCYLLLLFLISGCTSIENAESLYQEGDRQNALEMAVSLMEEEESSIRMRSVKLMGMIGGEPAGAALLEYLMDADTEVNREIIITLGRLQYEPALEKLLDLVQEADGSQKHSLSICLRSYGKQGIDKLVERFESAKELSSRDAYKDMLILIGPDIVPSMIGIMKGRSSTENSENLEIFQRLNHPRVARLMLDFLKDEEMAAQIMEFLIRPGSGASNAAIGALSEMKPDGDTKLVMERLIKLLGTLRNPQAVEVLEPLSRHQSKRIRDAVDQTLFQIRGY